MCRSSADGGRRCTGSAPRSQPPVSSRTWDGAPETAAETRFFDLRESGYAGPIDNDGYKVVEGQEAAHLLAGRDRL